MNSLEVDHPLPFQLEPHSGADLPKELVVQRAGGH